MKKWLALLLGVLFAFSFAACEVEAVGSNPSAHVHKLVKTSAKSATCDREGNIDYWTCSDCEKIYADTEGKTEITLEDTVVKAGAHDLKKVDGREKTCEQSGKMTYWECKVCKGYFADEKGEQSIEKTDVFLGYGEHTLIHHAETSANCKENGVKEYWDCSVCGLYFADEKGEQSIEKTDLFLGYGKHTLTHHPEIPVNGKKNGVKEYWDCSVCGLYFADSEGVTSIGKEELVIYSVMNIPDFTVDVPVGEDPVVLQLSDTQIIYAEQARAGREGVHWEDWAERNKDIRIYNYLRELITATDPDLIILTGDIVYGEFDDTGKALLDFIEFMESFEIFWAPVFGNHDNESRKGVDWQCQQFEAADYCLFKQRELTGNGNYSVAITQGGEIKRMFYMLDSNGCGNASAESMANGHTKNNFVGFGADQIAWYTNSIQQLKQYCPDAKISFAYHIQQAVFGEAWKKYGFNQSDKYQDINLDTMDGVSGSDFGYIGRQMKGPWDTNLTVWNGMKALGVDSIFVGHEHCNNASVVYEGVRLQFGQKSSEYDRFNSIDNEGVIKGDYVKHGTPLIGGTVMVLSKEDASIQDSYVYYCGFEDGKIDWDKYKTYDVQGLQKGTDLKLEDGKNMEMVGVPFDENGNAYKVNANDQGKVFINTELLKGKTTFKFSVYVPENCNNLAGMGPFAIRLKPDDGSMANVPNAGNYGGKYYIVYDVDTVDATKIIPGTWQTFTIDISSMNDKCTELSFLIAQGNTIYFKDITIS